MPEFMQENQHSCRSRVGPKGADVRYLRFGRKNLGLIKGPFGVQFRVCKESICGAGFGIRKLSKRSRHADAQARVIDPLFAELDCEFFQSTFSGVATEEFAARSWLVEQRKSVEVGLIQRRQFRPVETV